MTAILLVDADADRRCEIRESFQMHPDWMLLDTASAEDGRAAFREHSVDLVVLDLESAGAPGEELFEWIRADQARIPVILLTSDDLEDEARVEALVMGAASYVPLSHVARDLVVTIERILNLSGCNRRHARLSEGLITTETAFRIEGNDLSMVPVLVGHLTDTAAEFRVATAKNRVQLAVAWEEALLNAIVHGNLEVPSRLKEQGDDAFLQLVEQRRHEEPYAQRRLFVRGEFEQGFSRVTIADEGDGFDPAEVDDPTHPRNIDKPHGRGLFLIRAFMNEVTFNDVGNEVQLTKRVPQG